MNNLLDVSFETLYKMISRLHCITPIAQVNCPDTLEYIGHTDDELQSRCT